MAFRASLLVAAEAPTPAARADRTGVLVHEVLPSETDPRINTFSGGGFTHWSYFDPQAPARNLLVVFLPGTGGKGSGSVAFNTLAAREGFHLVALAYPDQVSISTFKRDADPDAFAKARENIVSGRVQFGGLGVDEANAIENRLLKLLQLLAARFPQEHWDQFLAAGQSIAWEKLILAGQSQGGGHAPFMAKKHAVARVLMFGAPKDYDARRQRPAEWYGAPSATPVNRYFSFVHSADEGHGCTYPQQLENYRALKLSPAWPVIDVDHAAPPYQHTRLLTSTARRANPHTSVIFNEDYASAWKYLLEEPVE